MAAAAPMPRCQLPRAARRCCRCYFFAAAMVLPPFSPLLSFAFHMAATLLSIAADAEQPPHAVLPMLVAAAADAVAATLLMPWRHCCAAAFCHDFMPAALPLIRHCFRYISLRRWLAAGYDTPPLRRYAFSPPFSLLLPFSPLFSCHIVFRHIIDIADIFRR